MDQIIKNEYDDGEVLVPNRFEKKYLKFINDFSSRDALADEIFDALKSKNIEKIETAMVSLANSIRTNLLLIGLTCLIVERENIYKRAGYRSYIEYSQTLFGKLQISNQSMSDAKIIMGAYVDHYKGLSNHGFRLERNAHKLKYIDEAISTHGDDLDEVYRRAANSTFQDFVNWARKPLIKHRPEPETRVNVEIKGNKLLIDGKNILNFPKNLPENLRGMVKTDLEKTFSIREGGNLPLIIETYDRGEQSAITNFLKQYRAKK
jgi:hypothetical protein